jgi:hypothetical protein
LDIAFYVLGMEQHNYKAQKEVETIATVLHIFAYDFRWPSPKQK